MSERTYSIGELCAEFDVTPRTLRFYEQRELLTPMREGQKRIFTQRDRGRLNLILRGKRFGFSLESIRRWLNLYDLGDGGILQMTTWIKNARLQMDSLREQRDEIDQALTELQELVEDTEKRLKKSQAAEKAGAAE